MSAPATGPGARGAWTLLRGAAWNQLGQILPILAALLIVPPLVRGLGVDRFGVLSLAWMLIGYFTLFDLGVSGALTRLVAERIASRREAEVPELVWTALAITTAMGTLGAVVVAACAPWLVGSVLRVPPELQRETLRLTWILAASLPVVTNTAALAGVLAAQQRFGVLNLIRVPMGILTYLAPLLALRSGPDLVPVGLALAAVRVAGGLAHLVACLSGTPGLAAGIRLRRAQVRPIVSFGGWMTVSAIVSPLMNYLDRFIVGAVLSVSMVAYYTTPYDMTQRLILIALPVVSVMFPAFAASFDSDRARTGRLFNWSVRAVASLLFPAVLVCTLFAGELLTLWLGADFALNSAPVLRLIALGVFVNGMAMVALSFLQSTGRPDLCARLHVLEVVPYLLLAWVLIGRFGIVGAALAWTVRVVVDAGALFMMAHRRLGTDAAGARAAMQLSVGGLVALGAGCFLPGLGQRVAWAAVLLAVFVVLVWRHVVTPGRQVLFEGAGRRV